MAPIFTTRVRNEGRLCFYRCLSVNTGGGGTPVSGPRSLPSHWSHVLSGGYPSLLAHVLSGGGGYPSPGWGAGTPVPGGSTPGQGYPLARTGWVPHSQDRTGVPSPTAMTGVLPGPWLGYPCGTRVTPPPPSPGLVTPRAVCFLWFPAGGLSCIIWPDLTR